MRIGLIATSSLSTKPVLGDTRQELVATRYGDVRVEVGISADEEVVLVRRAGVRHPLEPGRINTQAIMLALRELEVGSVLSTCVVGSLADDLPPGSLAVLSQFLDFTRHRPPTLFDDHGFSFTDMTHPYCPRVSALVARAADVAKLQLLGDRCYVGVDGPRYETAAEVRMFRKLGGDVVGHTGVTEAVMAREAGLCHAGVVLVSNYAAGLTDRPVSNEEVDSVRHHFAHPLEQLVVETLARMREQTARTCGCAESPGVPQLPTWSSVVGRTVGGQGSGGGNISG